MSDIKNYHAKQLCYAEMLRLILTTLQALALRDRLIHASVLAVSHQSGAQAGFVTRPRRMLPESAVEQPVPCKIKTQIVSPGRRSRTGVSKIQRKEKFLINEASSPSTTPPPRRGMRFKVWPNPS